VFDELGRIKPNYLLEKNVSPERGKQRELFEGQLSRIRECESRNFSKKDGGLLQKRRRKERGRSLEEKKQRKVCWHNPKREEGQNSSGGAKIQMRKRAKKVKKFQ